MREAPALHPVRTTVPSSRPQPAVVALVLATLASTAFFLAQGTTRLVASSALSVDRSFRPDESEAPPPAREEKTIATICERNIFDAEQGPFCTEDVVVPPVIECPEGQQANEEGECEEITADGIGACEGSIRLVASVVNPVNQAWSFAAIIGNAGSARLYRVGQSIDDKPVAFIGAEKVYLRGGSGMCFISLFGEEPEAPARARPNAPAAETPARPRRVAREGAISND
ncbi:MAG: hypothetical protein AAGH15_16375, partial [Myxococcota bacterium]